MSCSRRVAHRSRPQYGDSPCVLAIRRVECLTLLATLLMSAHAADGKAATRPDTTALAQEWRPLFDGHSTRGWRGFRQPAFPDNGWTIQDGVLKKIAGVRGGDLVTEEKFEEFELVWEWRIPAKANNGVKYFVIEERRAAIGHEYQMIDDTTAGIEKHRTAAFYDVLGPRADRKPPRIGEWNESRIVVHGQQVEHWLNGELVLSYTLGSPEVQQAIAASKFREVTGFGQRTRGHILLTDHGDEACFRNIRIRTPPPSVEAGVDSHRNP